MFRFVVLTRFLKKDIGFSRTENVSDPNSENEPDLLLLKNLEAAPNQMLSGPYSDNANSNKPLDTKLNWKEMLRPHSTPLFSLEATSLPKSSLENPFTYGRNALKFRMALEFANGTDLDAIKPSKKLPLEALVRYFEDKPIMASIGEQSKDVFQLGEPIQSNHARHILIATSWRSGSTFLGDLLSRYPGTFYSFEPLHFYDNKHGAGAGIKEEMQNAFASFLSLVFKCKPETGYFEHASKPENKWLFQHNFRLWNVCKNILQNETACFMPELYLQACPTFPIRLVKTVRLRVEQINRLLLDPELGEKLKVVVLVRDPRGVMNSRLSMEWCKDRLCSDPITVCKNLQSDVLAAIRLKKKFPG